MICDHIVRIRIACEDSVIAFLRIRIACDDSVIAFFRIRINDREQNL